MHDVADFTSKLAAWTAGVVPNAAVQLRSSGEGEVAVDSRPTIVVRLVRLDAEEGPRSRDALSRRAILTYCFDLCFADVQAQHQALADLAFGLLARDDLADGRKQVTGTDGRVEASFSVERLDPLPRAKPIRQALLDMRQQAKFQGFVSSGGVAIAGARVHIEGTDRLIVTDRHGAFAFAAPGDGTTLDATVSAKGRTASVTLSACAPNHINLMMEP